jgi:hypothetical protein
VCFEILTKPSLILAGAHSTGNLVLSEAIAEAAIESAQVLVRKLVEFVRVHVDPSEIPPLWLSREALEAVNFVHRRLGRSIGAP